MICSNLSFSGQLKKWNTFRLSAVTSLCWAHNCSSLSLSTFVGVVVPYVDETGWDCCISSCILFNNASCLFNSASNSLNNKQAKKITIEQLLFIIFAYSIVSEWREERETFFINDTLKNKKKII